MEGIGRWARILGTLWRHLKAEGTSNRALGVWALCISYSADNLTDGHLPTSVVEGFCKRDGRAWKATLADLTTPKWRGPDKEPTPWLRASEHGYRLHGYTDANTNRAQIEQRRGKDAARKATTRSKQKQPLSHDVPPGPFNSELRTQNSEVNPPSPLGPIAAVFREVSKHDTPTDIDPEWTHRERDAVRRLRSWCGGDLGKLRAQLTALAADPWLLAQPVHTWAERIGTKPKARGAALVPQDVDWDTAGQVQL